VSLERNLDAVYGWLCAAQDADHSGGVAGCYNLLKGWSGAYPETTGYIIPTFLHYADAARVPEAYFRALRMAEWEIDVQLPGGAVRSGMLGGRVGPAVFNTGQVLFGWVAAHRATADERYARAATKAAEWLVDVQDDDGAWRKHLSLLTTSSVQTYNARTAWGLAMAGKELGEDRWIRAALRNCRWAIDQQIDNGWFASNAFSDFEDPLLHTIGYVLEGLLGVGELLGSEECTQAAVCGASPLVEIYRRMGVLKGRYNRWWRGTTSWRCLTGEAQMALVLTRIARITGDVRYSECANRLIDGIARIQDLDSPYPESRGITGSHPIWGGYGPFNYFNWAAKFFMDALLLQVHAVDVQDPPAPAVTHATRAS
jgi:uncharacterized protein YyaL (SSP411 family)